MSLLADSLARAADPRQARKVWLAAEGRSTTYGELSDRIGRLAAVLAAEGVAIGDRVILASRDETELACLFLGLIACGVTAVPLDPDTRRVRAQALVAKARPKLVIADRALLEGWALAGHPVIEIAPRLAKAGLFGPKPKLEGLAARLEAAVPIAPPTTIDPETIAYILFTSGTTSQPKGVCVSHRALFAHLATLSRLYGYDADSRILNTLPLSHTDGMNQGPVIVFCNGASVYRPVRFEVGAIERVLDAVYQLRISHMVVAPTMLSLFVRLGSAHADAFSGGDFRLMISCAAALEPRLWEQSQTLFGVEIINVYGLTETVTGGLFKRGAKDGKWGSIGRPVDCETRIVDASGKDAEEGELLIRGELVMSGYFDDPAATEAVLRDGWLHTGDIARRDADGDHWILGRLKALVIRGGLNIHPEEVTEVLNRFPGVREAVAFGEPDADWGETLTAVVAADEGVSEADLLAWCREKLETRKVPGRLVVVGELPKGRTGKVLLEEVRALAHRSAEAPAAGGGDAQARVLRTAAMVFKSDPARLTLASSPEDVAGWDSLAHLELIAALEEEFGVSLAPRQIMALDSLGKALTYVQAA